MTNTATRHAKRPVIAHSLRILAVPIILFWIAIAVLVNVIAPQLEVVGEAHAAPMAPEDAPSMVGDEANGRQLQGIRFQQHGDDRSGGPAGTRPGRSRLLRRNHPPAAAGSRAHPAHPGLLGGYVNGGRSAERRRQSLLCDAEPRRRAGPDFGQRRRGRRSQGHRRTPKPRQECRLTSQAPPRSPTICTSSATPAWLRSP